MALYRERHGPLTWPGFEPGTQRWHPNSGPIRQRIREIAAELLDSGELQVRGLLVFQPAMRRNPGGLVRVLQSRADMAERYRWRWRELGEHPWWQAWLRETADDLATVGQT
jgi:hypothetical protein